MEQGPVFTMTSGHTALLLRTQSMINTLHTQGYFFDMYSKVTVLWPTEQWTISEFCSIVFPGRQNKLVFNEGKVNTEFSFSKKIIHKNVTWTNLDSD